MQKDLEMLARLIQQKIQDEAEREDEGRDGELIGELPTELLKKLMKLRKERERMSQDIELRKHLLALECQRKLEEEFDERQDEYTAKHKEIWGEVYKTMLIDPNGSYFQEDGKLYAYKKNNSIQMKMVDFTKPSRRR
jgi:hypothetical protein